MTSPLPPGRLYGHYSCKHQLYTVHSSCHDIVLSTPSPEEAPAFESSVIIPNFHQPRYLSISYAYLLFIPKHYAWRNPLFQSFDRPRNKLPIIKDGDEGFCLHPDVAENWLDLEHCLRALGKEMLRLAPQRWFSRLVSPWFFPARFKFMHKFRTEQAARFGAWRSIENFLPLLGYVSMGLWCMQSWEANRLAQGEDPPDWRLQVTQNTQVHPTFLDYLEKSAAGLWDEERVGALYHIQSPADLNSTEREQCGEMEWLLATILKSDYPIPIYLSWGKLPQQISLVDVPDDFNEFVPDVDELKYLASSGGQLKFSRWGIDQESLVWYRDPYRPASAPVVAAPLPPNDESPASAVVAAPFPPLPANSEQKKNETIQGFFIRRRARNLKKIANESSTDWQRRTQRAENAKRGVVPSKACVFVWEKQDEHYIRQPATRGNFADLWADYPGPQRRFNPIHNQWDLCELFEKNDPVFGEGYDHPPDDDSDDEMDPGDPIFPQNIDMESRLPPEVTEMEVVREHRPHEMELSIVDVPGNEDLGPDFNESDIPKRQPAEASKNCVNTVYLKFGLTPRTEEPEYASVGESLLDTLQKRFGFVMPATPDRFSARDPPVKCFASQDLANVVGMSNIGNQLASQKGLENILGIFFGQCTEARSFHSIDKNILDYHQPERYFRPLSPFTFTREYLKSMRTPSQHGNYYVLRRIGSGIGSEVLLIPHATDLIEVLRQQWGPEIKDVAGHFLARGIPFWLAYISAEIMPESKTFALRTRGFKPDVSSGLGFCPHKYNFDEHDYNAYITHRDLKLLHTMRGRIALQYGGIIARLARSEVLDDNFFHQFDDEIYNVGDCLWDGTSQHAYWYDRLSDSEIDLLCGVYHLSTGLKQGKGKQGQAKSGEMDSEQISTVSWWPKPNAWARGSLDGAWWTPQCETDFFQKRLSHFARGVYIPQRQTDWRHNLKFRKEVKKCWDGCETVAHSIVQNMIAAVEPSTS
ncbi:hypothetical protein B0H13DRAFT_2345794 [Mycena leptocephala]|nr:hypothetical protein B0H13DRAFT_2345794 [Mycena leptocephala]